jgi:Sigma-70, region 4.
LTIQDKKEALKKYQWICCEVKRLSGEILRLQSIAERATAVLSDMPKGGNRESRPVEKSAIAIDKLRNILRTEQNRLITERLRLMGAINSVEDDRLRSVLNLRYIEDFTFEKIAVELEISYQWACKLHGDALEKILLT